MVVAADVEEEETSQDIQRASSIRMAALAGDLEVGVVGPAGEDVISRAAMPMRLRVLEPVDRLCRREKLSKEKKRSSQLQRQRRMMQMTERYALFVPPMSSIRPFLRVITAPAISVR